MKMLRIGMSAPAQTCATCGKDVRESSERRNSGGRWYCSAYCALHDEVAKSHKRTTEVRSAPHRLSRTLALALVFILVLVAASVAAVAIESGGTSPIALGQTHTFGECKLAVASVDWNASAAPPAARSIQIAVAVQYLGAGESRPPFGFYVEGAHRAIYAGPDGAQGIPETVPVDSRFSGARERFGLDFTVATDDLDTLKLYVETSSAKAAPVVFALHAS
jgi:hypothetical protein